MKSIVVKGVGLSPCIKLFAAIFASIGFLVGIIALMGSLIGLPVVTTLPFVRFSGIAAGVVSLALGPVVFGFFGLFVGLVGYYPFSLLIRALGGLRLNGGFDQEFQQLD